MSQLYAVSPLGFNSAPSVCDCLAHRFGNAADRPERVRRYPSDNEALWAICQTRRKSAKSACPRDEPAGRSVCSPHPRGWPRAVPSVPIDLHLLPHARGWSRHRHFEPRTGQCGARPSAKLAVSMNCSSPARRTRAHSVQPSSRAMPVPTAHGVDRGGRPAVDRGHAPATGAGPTPPASSVGSATQEPSRCR